MLASSGEPFDSDDYFFEWKWDGYRALFISDTADSKLEPFRLLSRNELDFRPYFPELKFLAELPQGTALDGEIVALDENGRPDFQGLQNRFYKKKQKQPAAGRKCIYVAFDILYVAGEPVMNETLTARRDRLSEIVQGAGEELLLLSDGITGKGKAFFEAAAEQSLEGIVAKKLTSRYTPGKRSDAWIKIKRRQEIFCIILGYLPKGKNDLKSLVVASDYSGTLAYSGNVGSGMGERKRRELAEMLAARPAEKPLVPCDQPAKWVTPGLYCRVSFSEFTGAGIMRAPVFEELILEPE